MVHLGIVESMEAQMLTLEEIRDRLLDRRIQTVADRTGLNYYTIRKIRAGGRITPQYRTMKLLSDYLLEQGRFQRGSQ